MTTVDIAEQRVMYLLEYYRRLREIEVQRKRALEASDE